MDELKLSYQDAYDLALDAVDAAQQKAWLDEWHRNTGGQTLVHGSKRLSVIDSPADHNTSMRTLHFNDRIDLIQTACLVDAATNEPLPSLLPPHTRGMADWGTHCAGLALAVPLMCATSGAPPTRIVVLGAGGGALPAFLHAALPGAVVDAVELSGEVCAVARECFGVGAAEATGRLRLHEDCAFAWLERTAPASLDLIVVDLESDSLALAAPGVPLAPPARALEPSFIALARSRLTPRGILAFNTLGTADAIESMAEVAIGACVHADAPGDSRGVAFDDTLQRMLFTGPLLDEAPPPTREALRSALIELGGPFVGGVARDAPPSGVTGDSLEPWVDRYCVRSL